MTVLTILILFGIGAAIVASNKGASGILWFFLGVILGPIGLLLAFFSGGKRCPYCKSKIHKDATICPKCQQKINIQAAHPIGKILIREPLSPNQKVSMSEIQPSHNLGREVRIVFGLVLACVGILVFIDALDNEKWVVGNIGLGLIFGGIWFLYIGFIKTKKGGKTT